MRVLAERSKKAKKISKISIIVPAYNEEGRIEKTLRDLRRIPNVELIVVCNGCTDATADVARTVKGVKVLEIEEKNKGTAVLHGFKLAQGEYIGFVDADGVFGAEAVQRLLAELADADCVIASKRKGHYARSFSGHSFSKRMATKAWNRLVKFLLGLDFADTQAGLKFMHSYVYDAIEKKFTCKGFAFDVELLYKIKKAGYRIKEIYIPIKPVRDKVGFSLVYAPKMFKELLTFWLSEKLKLR